MKFLIVNGPNINMLGIREPDIYGTLTYEGLLEYLKGEAARLGCEVEFFQSNSEGELVTAIQKALGRVDGIVINPAAYTHTSVAILDALKAVALPAAEVHLSDGPSGRLPADQLCGHGLQISFHRPWKRGATCAAWKRCWPMGKTGTKGRNSHDHQHQTGNPAAELEKIIHEFEAKGLSVTMIRGTDYNVFGLVGDTTILDEKQIRGQSLCGKRAAGVRAVQKPNRLFHEADSIIDVAGVKVGGHEKIVVIGGPCSVEGEQPTIDVAKRSARPPAAPCCGAAPTSPALRPTPFRAWAPRAFWTW